MTGSSHAPRLHLPHGAMLADAVALIAIRDLVCRLHEAAARTGNRVDRQETSHDRRRAPR